MKFLQLRCSNGVYSAPIDITVNEWKEMLVNEKVFYESALKMVLDWYEQPFHQATSKEMMEKNNIKGRSPYNGIVVGLGKAIVKFLNRFEVLSTTGKGKSYFIIVFEGWHENYEKGGNFIWKLRAELVQALEELHLVKKNRK